MINEYMNGNVMRFILYSPNKLMKNKKRLMSKHQHSAYILLASLLLPKASHMVKIRVNVPWMNERVAPYVLQSSVPGNFIAQWGEGL